jgi:hypothetical protein
MPAKRSPTKRQQELMRAKKRIEKRAAIIKAEQQLTDLRRKIRAMRDDLKQI